MNSGPLSTSRRGWEKRNLPGWTRLRRNGVSFSRAFCSTCMCSPSRASLMTGLFPAQHGVTDTLALGPSGTGQQVLPTNLPNLATVMSEAGYEVVYKGKWHLSKPQGDPDDDTWQPSDVARYGFSRWNPPDAGENQDIDQFGGGNADNDGRFMEDRQQEGALDYLRGAAAAQQPFCLVVSLVNPHDVLAYPSTWRDGGYEGRKWLRGSIDLPPNQNDNLRTKPTVQREILVTLAEALGPLPTRTQQRNYLNFYGNVLKEADRHLVELLDTLDETGLTDNTVIVATSDHGEMGLSHGGLRQKAYNVYEETLRVPLVWSNPALFPKPRVAKALVSHVDLLPTLATLFGASDRGTSWQGIDYSAVVQQPTRKGPQDYVAFTFDDHPDLLAGDTRIRCIREGRYNLARYFDADKPNLPDQWEMYDLKEDPLEMVNIAYRGYRRTPKQQAQLDRLRTKLAEVEQTRLQPL
ncbi:MAG: sulfatase-like hydrolase/transferase [Thermomicrobiales bacterium]